MHANPRTTQFATSLLPQKSSGEVVNFDGETWYKISNANAIEPFFMTITSSSDVWNFIWSNGALSAGRKNSEHAIFPYLTADKILDMGACSGNLSAVKIFSADGTFLWKPFDSNTQWKVERNVYKNSSGSHIILEEVNTELDLIWRTEWTSSDKYGLVKISSIKNRASKSAKVQILDGAQNIVPACGTMQLQATNSILLDAYKKSDLEKDSGLALFSLSSVLTDRAEPSEALWANTCWFSKKSPVYLDPQTPEFFAREIPLEQIDVLKGKRASCFISFDLELEGGAQEKWEQVFDTHLENSKIALLKKELADRAALEKSLLNDIEQGKKLLEKYIGEADGLQNTADKIACMHHEANVMFNIMRGGVFAENNSVRSDDFIGFVETRNKAKAACAKALNLGETVNYAELGKIVKATRDAQLYRLYLEYLPLSFSRRHGDPSRPWNKFSINLKDSHGNPILNYEGNWRDIFQNWEALAMSYPAYTSGMIAKFLNATTADGFNPYRITRAGIDWEIPEPDNPWSNIGYWNDHQIIYLSKLLELEEKINPAALDEFLNSAIYTVANVPYHIKAYAQIQKNPRDTIVFDFELNEKISAEVERFGSDAKLFGKNGEPYLVTMAEKVLQLILTKMANFVPAGGIWMNTQRPEWNDANNALAGYGLSVVTLCYLRRFMVFVKGLFEKSSEENFILSAPLKKFLEEISGIYKSANPENINSGIERKIFVEKCENAFEAERFSFYENPESLLQGEKISKAEIISALDAFIKHAEHSIKLNKRSDGLYHSYNTLEIGERAMEILNLEEMLEGQVAVLSSGLLDAEEICALCDSLAKSRMYEPRQNSYMLYPSKELPRFANKNVLEKSAAQKIATLKAELERGYTLPDAASLVYNDSLEGGKAHFNPDFRNAEVLENAIEKNYPQIGAEEKNEILSLYEKTFNHKSFTGRSGTFYAYEGIGSIYWHMVSKLLLAVQENFQKALSAKNEQGAKKLGAHYYKIRAGLSFNKTPEIYGAFPIDPYSHTPYLQGAKQPGMTGQVKEEVITRWGELGMEIENGSLRFNPALLLKKEFGADGTLSFTRFKIPFVYKLDGSISAIKVTVDSATFGAEIPAELSADIFSREGKVKSVTVEIPSNAIFAE